MCGSGCPPCPCMVWPWKAGNPGHWGFHRAWPSGSCPLLCTRVPLAAYGPLGGLSTLAHSQFFLGPFQDWPFFLNASCLGTHRSCTFSHCSSSADSIFSLEVVTTGLGEPCSRNWAFGNKLREGSQVSFPSDPATKKTSSPRRNYGKSQ